MSTEQPTTGRALAIASAEQSVPDALNAALIEQDFAKLSPENRS